MFGNLAKIGGAIGKAYGSGVGKFATGGDKLGSAIRGGLGMSRQKRSPDQALGGMFKKKKKKEVNTGPSNMNSGGYDY